MDSLSINDSTPGSPISCERPFDKVHGDWTVMGSEAKRSAFAQQDYGVISITKPHGRFDQCVQHSWQIEGRPANDFENVSSRSLLLQGLAQLVQQARVLNGDDRLVSEDLQQLLVLFRSGAWHGPTSDDR